MRPKRFLDMTSRLFENNVWTWAGLKVKYMECFTSFHGYSDVDSTTAASLHSFGASQLHKPW
jgi:hypothetical protein